MTNFSAYNQIFRSSRGSDLFTEDAHLSAMLRVEAALARAEGRLGIIPSEAAEIIASCCSLERIDHAAIAQESAAAGNLAIPLVKQLTAIVRERNPDAAGYVHWGATSQDILDSAMVLQLREHLTLISELLDTLCRDLAGLTIAHRDTLMVGRTWLQHAVPITFGLKVAGWLDACLRHRERLADLRPRVLVLQFGGAAGTLASLGADGIMVAQELAQQLDLGLPDISWHTHRDRFAEVATFHGLLTGTIGKIARDISLCGQTEVSEVSEPTAEGRGASSTMPHKRNPVISATLLAASIRIPGLVSTMLSAMVQEHERGLGGWHAEWETLPAICTLSSGALEKLASMIPELNILADRMRRNLEATNGLIAAEAVSMALAKHTGREIAHNLVEKASHQAMDDNTSLRTALSQSAEISASLGNSQLDALVDPANYLGSAATMIDNVLARYRSFFPSNGRER